MLSRSLTKQLAFLFVGLLLGLGVCSLQKSDAGAHVPAPILAATGDPIKIMAIGDSITEDNPATLPGASGGWRVPLYGKLTTAGKSVQFVGSHNVDTIVVPNVTGHEAYGGWATCDFFTDGRASVRNLVHDPSWDIAQSLATYAPDVVVIDIGTNNYINKMYFDLGFVTTLECPPTVANMHRLFDAALNAPSNPKIVITTIEDASIPAGTDPVNSLIESYVTTKRAAGEQVCLARVPANLAGYTNPNDRFHLNAAGKEAVANALLPEVVNAINNQCDSSVTTTTAPPPAPASCVGGTRVEAEGPTVSGGTVVTGGRRLAAGERATFQSPSGYTGVGTYSFRIGFQTASAVVGTWQSQVGNIENVTWTTQQFFDAPRTLTATPLYTISGVFTVDYWDFCPYPFVATGATTTTGVTTTAATTTTSGATTTVANPTLPPPPPSVSTYRLYPTNPTAGYVAYGGTALTTGVKFRSTTAGTVTEVRWYKQPNDTGSHVVTIWNGSTQVASTVAQNETASGWQTVPLTAPIAANTLYTVSVFHPSGGYVTKLNGMAAGLTSGPLSMPASGVVGGNGVYAYGSSSQNPVQSYAASDYAIDVTFVVGTVTTTTSSTTTSTSTSVPLTTTTICE